MALRLSLHRTMALLMLVALTLGLGIPAAEVYRTKEYHMHTGISIEDPPTFSGWNGIEPPFWPRYLKRLVGRPWQRQPCSLKAGFEADRCEFAYPDMALKVGTRVVYNFDTSQQERLEELVRKRSKGKPSS